MGKRNRNYRLVYQSNMSFASGLIAGLTAFSKLTDFRYKPSVRIGTLRGDWQTVGADLKRAMQKYDEQRSA